MDAGCGGAFARWALPVVEGPEWLETPRRSRFPAGMTTRNAEAKATAKANAEADSLRE